MNALIVGVLTVLAVAAAAPSGVVLSGPSGIVTDHGPIGPVGHGHGVGIVAPIAVGLGGWGGLGGLGGLGHGAVAVGHGGWGHGGLLVKGPGTVPVTIAGPAGSVSAKGLWGPTLTWAHGGHEGHGW